MLGTSTLISLPIEVQAEGFYECVDPATGKAYFTTGGLPNANWKCKGFGMRNGGFTKIKAQAPSRSANGPATQKAATGRKGLSMADLWKKSLKRNAAD